MKLTGRTLPNCFMPFSYGSIGDIEDAVATLLESDPHKIVSEPGLTMDDPDVFGYKSHQ